jgi:hypothetical protein
MPQADHKHAVIIKILNESGFPAKLVDFMVSEIRFASGEIMATPGARHSFKMSNENPTFYLWRHLCGDCGIVGPRECPETEPSEGRAIVSCYRLRTGALIWCITDAARLTTAFVTPDEVGSI